MRRAGLDQSALEVCRHIDLEPAVAEGVVAKNDPAIHRLCDRYVVIEPQHTRGGRGEHPDGALIGVEVIVGAHLTHLLSERRLDQQCADPTAPAPIDG